MIVWEISPTYNMILTLTMLIGSSNMKTKTVAYPKKKIRRKCSECGEWFTQEIVDYGSKTLTTDDYDEFCENCNRKAMR